MGNDQSGFDQLGAPHVYLYVPHDLFDVWEWLSYYNICERIIFRCHPKNHSTGSNSTDFLPVLGVSVYTGMLHQVAIEQTPPTKQISGMFWFLLSSSSSDSSLDSTCTHESYSPTVSRPQTLSLLIRRGSEDQTMPPLRPGVWGGVLRVRLLISEPSEEWHSTEIMESNRSHHLRYALFVGQREVRLRQSLCVNHRFSRSSIQPMIERISVRGIYVQIVQSGTVAALGRIDSLSPRIATRVWSGTESSGLWEHPGQTRPRRRVPHPPSIETIVPPRPHSLYVSATEKLLNENKIYGK